MYEPVKTDEEKDTEIEAVGGQDDADEEMPERKVMLKDRVVNFLRNYWIWCILTVLVLVASIVCTALFLHKTMEPAPVKLDNLTHLVVFGDSYSVDECDQSTKSDSAQQLIVQGIVPRCPTFKDEVQSGPYFRTWVQYLQNDQDTGALQNKFFITSEAIKGAACDRFKFWTMPGGASDQLKSFRQRYRSYNGTSVRMPFPQNTTALVIFFGTNDLYSMVNGYGTVEDETECKRAIIEDAYSYGFRNMIVMQHSPVDRISKQKYAKPFKWMIRSNLSNEKVLLGRLRKKYKDSNLYLFPTYEILSSMQRQLTPYGFHNASACSGCDRPYEHVWNDYYHITSRTMHILSRKFVRFLLHGARGEDLIGGAEDVQ